MHKQFVYIGVAIWVLFLSVTAVLAAPFRDDPTGTSWWSEAALMLQDQGIIQGYADGSFRPEQALNRAEMAKILVTYSEKILDGLPQLVSSEEEFSDVESSDWFGPYVSKGAKAGLFAGYPDGSFGPGRLLNRAEVAKILVRLAGWNPTELQGHVSAFSDVEDDQWYTSYARRLEASGVITGFADQTFRPGDVVSRGEFAVMLHRLHQQIAPEATSDDTNSEDTEDDTEVNEEEEVSRQAGVTLTIHPFTPPTGSVPAGATNVPYVTLLLEVEGETLYLQDIAAKRVGVGDARDFSGMTFHVDGRRIGSSRAINTDTQMVRFEFVDGVAFAPGTYTLEIRGNMRSDLTTATGEHGFTIDQKDIHFEDGSGVPVKFSGTFPLKGMLHKQVAVETGSLAVSRGVSPSTSIYAGQSDVPLAEFRFVAGAREDLLLRGIQFTQRGSVAPGDLARLTLWDVASGDLLAGPTDIRQDDTVFFDLRGATEGGLIIPRGSSARLRIRADIVGGSRKTVSFDLADPSDVDVLGMTYGQGVPVTSTLSDEESMIDAKRDLAATLEDGGTAPSDYTALGTVRVHKSDLGNVTLSLKSTGESSTAGLPAIREVFWFDANGTMRVRKSVANSTSTETTFRFDNLTLPVGVYTLAVSSSVAGQFPDELFAELGLGAVVQELLVERSFPFTYAFIPLAGHALSAGQEQAIGFLAVRNTGSERLALARLAFAFPKSSPLTGDDFASLRLYQFGRSQPWQLVPGGDRFSFSPTSMNMGAGETLYLKVTGIPRVSRSGKAQLYFDSVTSQYVYQGKTVAMGDDVDWINHSSTESTNTSSQAAFNSDAVKLGAFEFTSSYDTTYVDRLTFSTIDPKAAANIATLYVMMDGKLYGQGVSIDGDNQAVFSFPFENRIVIPPFARKDVEVYGVLASQSTPGTTSGTNIAMYLSNIRARGSNNVTVSGWTDNKGSVTISEQSSDVFAITGTQVQVGDVLYRRNSSSQIEYAVITGVRTGYLVEGDADSLPFNTVKVRRAVGESTGMHLANGTVDVLRGERTGITVPLSSPLRIEQATSWIPREMGSPLPGDDLWSITVHAGGSDPSAPVDVRLLKLRIAVSGTAAVSGLVMKEHQSGRIVATGVGSHSGAGVSYVTFDLSGADSADVLMVPGSKRTYDFEGIVDASGATSQQPKRVSLGIANLGGVSSSTFGVDTDVVWQDSNSSANGGAGRTVDVYWVDMERNYLYASGSNSYTSQ